MKGRRFEGPQAAASVRTGSRSPPAAEYATSAIAISAAVFRSAEWGSGRLTAERCPDPDGWTKVSSAIVAGSANTRMGWPRTRQRLDRPGPGQCPRREILERNATHRLSGKRGSSSWWPRPRSARPDMTVSSPSRADDRELKTVRTSLPVDAATGAHPPTRTGLAGHPMSEPKMVEFDLDRYLRKLEEGRPRRDRMGR